MGNAEKLSARDRIATLLDDYSFVEVGAYVTKRNTDFNLQQKEAPSDGVITGYGLINGNPVYVYSQDSSVLSGTIGEMHAKKIVHIYELALKVGAPVIGLVDCAGLRLQEATDALNGFGEIYLKKTLASGVIPQITAIFGVCGGGSAVLSALSDFTFMEKNNGKLFVNTPNTLDGNYVAKCDTSSASYQEITGLVDVVAEDEASLLASIRDLVSILPANNFEDSSYEECEDDLNRVVPTFAQEIKDSLQALRDISDLNYFYELKAEYAKEMVTGFIRLNGVTVGAVANRVAICDETGKVLTQFDGSLTTAGCEKAAKFVNFCDAFQIPVLTLTNVTGYKATVEEEKTIAEASAKLTYAFANATVPKVNVIVGKAFGSAYITMNSKHIGADMVFATEGASIGVMDAKSAVEIIYSEEISAASDALAVINEKTTEYDNLQSSALAAAKRGYVDSMIDSASVRKQVIYAFEMLATKNECRPEKKHSTF